MIIKTKKEIIYGDNVHKHTKIMKTSKKVNIIFRWNVRNTKDL